MIFTASLLLHSSCTNRASTFYIVGPKDKRHFGKWVLPVAGAKSNLIEQKYATFYKFVSSLSLSLKYAPDKVVEFLCRVLECQESSNLNSKRSRPLNNIVVRIWYIQVPKKNSIRACNKRTPPPPPKPICPLQNFLCQH